MATFTLPEAPLTGVPESPDAAAPLREARRHHLAGHLLQAAECYRQALAAEPNCTPALLGLSLIARHSGQLLPALHMAQAAVSGAPHSALAHCALAHGYQALRALTQAEAHFREAIRLNPAEISALLGLAELLVATSCGHPERLAAACDFFYRVLALKPNLPAAFFGLGNILALQEDYAAALASFQRALELQSQSAAEANQCHHHFAIAYAHAKLGQHPQAIHHYREAVAQQPNFASAWLNLGVSLIADGRDVLGEACYRQALEADPALLSAHLNLGNLERSRRRFPRAEAHYTRALTLQPGSSVVHVAFSYLHLEQGLFAQAHLDIQTALACDATHESAPHPAVLDPALENLHLSLENPTPLNHAGHPSQPGANPKNPEIPNALGILLLAEAAAGANPEKIDRAIEAFAQAEALGHKTAPSNRGNALLRLGRIQEALEAHQKAVALDPAHPGARYNLALTQIRMGDYAQGWPNYEIRWAFRDVHPRPRRFPQPRWRGEPLLDRPANQRRLFLYAEQGLGDTLQFVRYLPLVAALGAEIVLEVQPPLARLLRPFVESLGHPGGHLIAAGDSLPEFDLHCPLLSLPAVFGTTRENVPSRIPYLFADSALIAARAREFRLPSATRQANIVNIGLAWAGNPHYPADHERSTHLGSFAPLLHEFHDLSFFSLQKGDTARQIQSLPPAIAAFAPVNACACDVDLAATAALIANLDLVISTDTAVAHLAGALGKPLWLLLPWQSDWRWGQDLPTTPWYPQARLFRQSSPGNWPELIGRVIDALHEDSFLFTADQREAADPSSYAFTRSC